MAVIFSRNYFSSLMHGGEPKPEIFLAGPTPRTSGEPSWRHKAIGLFDRVSKYVNLLIPEEPRGGLSGMDDPDKYEDQVEWEHTGLKRAAVIMFWIPRDLERMPGFTTNIEFGMYMQSGKIVVGAPSEAKKMSYIRECCARYNIPLTSTLEGTVQSSLELLDRIHK